MHFGKENIQVKSKSDKSIFRKYYWLCSIINVCYFAIIVALAYACWSIWTALLCIALYLPVRILCIIVAKKTIAKVLVEDLDAERFNNLIYSSKKFIPSLDYRLSGAIYAGYYKAAINISTAKLRESKSTVFEKNLCLSYLAMSYFELRDYKKLKTIIQKYDELKKANPKSKCFSNNDYTWDYYRAYLENNFEYCKSLSVEKNASPNSKSRHPIYNDFHYAVACYANGEKDDAKIIFEKIITKAPKLHIAEISNEYIEAIDNNVELKENRDILPDEDFQLYSSKPNERLVSAKKTTAVLMIIIGVFWISNPTFNGYSKSIEEAREREQSYYDNCDYYFTVEEDDFIVDFLINEENFSIIKTDIRERNNKHYYKIKTMTIHETQQNLPSYYIYSDNMWTQSGKHVAKVEWVILPERECKTEEGFAFSYDGKDYRLLYRIYE